MSINEYLDDNWTDILQCLGISEDEQVTAFSLLETINIEIIEQFLRKKKLEKINNV